MGLKLLLGLAVVGGAGVWWGATQASERSPVVATGAELVPPGPPEVASPLPSSRPSAVEPKRTTPPPPEETPAGEDDIDAATVVEAPDNETTRTESLVVKLQPERRPHRGGERANEGKKEGQAEADVLAEARRVAEARRALGSDPARALALTRDLSREFPRGQLVEEREAIAIRALAGLGRRDDAVARAEVFLRKHGDGPHADAVRRAVGLE